MTAGLRKAAAFPMDWQEMLELVRQRLFTAVIGDILDSLGYRHQFLPREIQPLDPRFVVAGRAMPVLYADSSTGEAPPGGNPFGLMLQALDDLKPGEVYVAAGASSHYALWGELMSTRAHQLRAAGAVLDGVSRDTRGILALKFPTFSRGRYAQDVRTRGFVADFRVPVQIGQVQIQPGDLIFGDLDGVVVAPQAVAPEVIQRALDKVNREDQVRTAIRNGMAAAEAFERYGVM